MKLVITILFAMMCVLFYYQNDLYVKLKREEMVNRLTFEATNEVLQTHAKAINDQTELLVDMVRGDWRTS